jgi:hypothetical protein
LIARNDELAIRAPSMMAGNRRSVLGSVDTPHAGGAMMQRLGVEVGGGIIPRYSLTYAAAFRQCETCQCVAECSKWLAAETARTFAPAFCPGADILFELAFDGQSASRLAVR